MNPALGLVPGCTEAQARELLEKRRWYRRARCLRRIEQVWLPCQCVELGEALLLVDGYARTAIAFNQSHLKTRAIESEFPYPLNGEETLAIARESLLQWRLSRLVKRLPASSLALGGQLYYPYWAGYEESRTGNIRFRLVDALTGRPARQAIQLGFLEALRADRDPIPEA